MKSIYIVGTEHPIQCTSVDFKSYLEQQCITLKVQLLVEEMSLEGKKRKCHGTIKETMPEKVAKELNIEHKLCDPNSAEREELGIVECGLIKCLGHLYNEPEEIIKKKIKDEYDKREQEWLRRISQFDKTPILLVCGASHCFSFKEKAENDGFGVVLLTKEWK